MSTWSRTYKQSVFQRCHSDKHFSEFYLQDGAKSPGIDREQNYFTVTLCIGTFRAVDHAGARVLHCVPQNVYLFYLLIFFE